MAGFENRVILAKELSLRTEVEAEIPEPVVGIYETKVSGGNTRVCVRIPKPWDRSVDKSKADEKSKKLDSAIREFQANDWSRCFRERTSLPIPCSSRKDLPTKRSQRRAKKP